MSRRRKRFKKKGFFETIDYSRFEKTKPYCQHFGLCGGCRFQDISYQDQLSIKKEYLKKIFGWDFEIIESPEKISYRNRMDFVFHKGILGLRKKGDFKFVVDINDCQLIPTKYQKLYWLVKNEIKNRGISSYDLITQKGFLRYVVFRFAPNTGEAMIIFTTTKPSSPEEEEDFNNLLETISTEVKSIYWFINDGLGDLSIPPLAEAHKVLGTTEIKESLNEIELSFGPKSFFQANSAVSEIILKDIRSWVLPGDLVDLCCGVGTIGLSVADKVRSVVGLESIPEAIEIARKNAKNNKIKNALFFTADMKEVMEFTPLNLDTLVIDPPRAGLGLKVIKKIDSLKPERIIYMSCNPKTQKIDLDHLMMNKEYKIVSYKAYDMFPQTDHVETIIILDKNYED